MRPLTLALALFLSVLTAFAAEPDNSKAHGASLYEGLAQIIEAGPGSPELKLWAQRSARALDGEAWLEVDAVRLHAEWIKSSERAPDKAEWRKPEALILFSLLCERSTAYNMTGELSVPTVMVRKFAVANVKLPANAPALTKIMWQWCLWDMNLQVILSPTNNAKITFLKELTQAVKDRAQLTPRQWNQLTLMLPMADKRGIVHMRLVTAKEYDPLVAALKQAEDFKPAASRHILLGIIYRHLAWNEKSNGFADELSEVERDNYLRYMGLTEKELKLARKTAAFEHCNLSPFILAAYDLGSQVLADPNAVSKNPGSSVRSKFGEECLALSRSDVERAEVLDLLFRHAYTGPSSAIDDRFIKTAHTKDKPDTAVYLQGLVHWLELNGVSPYRGESHEDLRRRVHAAMDKEYAGMVAAVAAIQKAGVGRKERPAIRGLFIDPKAIIYALFAIYWHNSKEELAALRQLNTVPDGPDGKIDSAQVLLTNRHLYCRDKVEAQGQYPHRDCAGQLLLLERPSLANEWWGWPAASEEKPQFEASFIEAWSQPGKIDSVLATLKAAAAASPALSDPSKDRLDILRQTAEATREYHAKGVLRLPWSSPVWRQKNNFYRVYEDGNKLHLGSFQQSRHKPTPYKGFNFVELRAPLPQPYALEFTFEHSHEMFPEGPVGKSPFALLGLWLEDPEDNPRVLFSGIRTLKQPGGAFFAPSKKFPWSEPTFFSLPKNHPKADGKATEGLARVEVRDGYVKWYLDGVLLYDSQKAGAPAMADGLVRLGILAHGTCPAMMKLGPVTITKLK